MLNLPFYLKPSVKLMRKGVAYLDEAELLAIVFGRGSSGKNALVLAQEVLSKCNLTEFNKLGFVALEKLCCGKGKAMQVLAVIELAKRYMLLENKGFGSVVTCAKDVYALFSWMKDLEQEQFYVVLLDTKHQIIKKELVTVGLLNSSLIHPREVFKLAIRENACAIILVHNHPSGSVVPSSEDLSVTSNLVKAGSLLGIEVLDHVIIGDGYWSWNEKNEVL